MRYGRIRLLIVLLGFSCAMAWGAEPHLCPQTKTPKFIDGRLNDWSEPFFALDGWYWRAAENVRPVYGGYQDLSATVRMAWDAQYLYLAIVVIDDIFHPAKEEPFDAGDAVILRFAAANKEPAPKPLELVLVSTPLAQVLERDSDGDLSPLEHAKLGFARVNLPAPITPIPHEDGKGAASPMKCWYECAIPWDGLPLATVAAGSDLGMEIQVRDDDGQGVRGCLRWRGRPNEARTPGGLALVRLGP